ncbi:hypothetical protein MVEN_00391400 [Mycena venus]|uniref:Probable 26S proteasome regulatory subunit p27 n=1 Tax=Mycena venus TaxID=2733690 RepID=A0A8H6YS04_9AGAR|nr:hypothetical protein MVEN_00391400 [Mycena venus]
MASPADTARALMLQKDNIESQIQLQAGILAVNNGSTMDSPLVDSEGFPRADIDIYAVRNARIRIIELRNDLAAVMNSLSLALQSVYDPALAPPDTPQSSTESKPFAKVDGVSPGSPAAEAGLQRDDLVVKFGTLTQQSFSSSSLKPLVDVVAAHENRSIPLKVLRSDQFVFLSLTPKAWGGRGLLGCHIVPYSPPEDNSSSSAPTLYNQTCNLIPRTFVPPTPSCLTCLRLSALPFPPSSSVTPPKVNAVGDKDALLAVSTPTLPSLKDVRAFEHDRQRVKKAADLVKMRARKGQGRWSALAKGELYNSSRKSVAPVLSEKQRRLRAEEVDTLEGPLADNGCDVDGVTSCNPSQPSEVKLADLITFRKPRKAVGVYFCLLSYSPERATDNDFVVIPQRSVIVLDDITSHDLLVDEPWDLLDDEDSPSTTPTKALSYAEILSAHTK